MAVPSKIHSKPYRNWVRGALGLFYLQEGLHPFTDRVVKAEHMRIIQTLTPCSSCTIRDILPEHAKGVVCIQKIRGKCNCRQKTKKACNTCGKIYDEIILHHRHRDPTWVTDCSIWCSDHWQIAKCLMTTANHGSSNSAAEIDAAGLLSIIINGLFFQTEIQCNIESPHDAFSQVREIRNEILHGSTLELTDNEVTRYLQAMVAILEDQKTLLNDPSAKASVKKLKEIINDSLVISTMEEAKAVQIALDAINEEKEQSQESIRKLTTESVKEITTTKDHALEKLQTSLSAKFEENYEPELKELRLSHDDHKHRLETVETELKNVKTEQQNIKERLILLEKQLSLLKKAEEKHQKRIDYLQRKQELQQFLVDQYELHYAKTWISPLMTQQNSVDIKDVYVSPEMVVEEKDENMVNTNDEIEELILFEMDDPGYIEKCMQTKVRQVSILHDILYTKDIKNQRIYVIGDVGTGKSSFCKMVMRNWCISLTKRRNTREQDATKKQPSKLEDDSDIKDLNEFEFLFYIPLRIMSGYGDTFDMIKSQLPDYRTLLDEIFINDSGSCLILVDGLDEWNPPKAIEPVLQHVTYGIPASRLVRNATIITTSRPSAQGILSMKSSECDLRVTLLGIHNRSVKPMIEKYMRMSLSKGQSSDQVADFEQKLYNVRLGHLRQTPMLLQQLIWMYCNDYEIGKSTSYIYTNIVNILLAWVNDKMGTSFTLNQNIHIRDLKLPKLFDKYVRCQDNRQLIMLLGKVAYDTFVKKGGSNVVFGRHKLRELGLSDDDINAVLHFGLFIEENSADPTFEKSQISFIHTSFLEFFAAVFISGYYLTQSHTPQSKVTVLEDIFMQLSSAEGILKLKDLIIMVCGLSPFLTERVCECIYQIISTKYTPDRQHLIQNICFQCLSEAYSSKQITSDKDQTYLEIKLYNLIMEDYMDLNQCFTSVIPSSLLTCVSNVRYFSHEQCSSLTSFLSQAVSLQTLDLSYVKCPKDGCEGHSIDLSYHKLLRSVSLYRCNNVFVYGVINTYLEKCKISKCKVPHQLSLSLSSLLPQAVSLRTLDLSDIICAKDDCESHSIDLSNHKHGENVSLDECKQECISGEYNFNLETCVFRNCRFSHDLCSSLTSFLSQAVSLGKLDLSDIACTKDDCEGHVIDLSYHKLLRSVSLYRCNNVFVFGVINTYLEKCKVSKCKFPHQLSLSLSSLLPQAVSLRTLDLSDITCANDECESHSIDLSSHKHGENVSLDECKQECISGEYNFNLETCVFRNCRFSHDLCSSLTSFLSQAVSLRTLDLSDIACTKDDCEGHSIDLSYHKLLRSVSLFRCNQVCVYGENNAFLERCVIRQCRFPHYLSSSLTSFLSEAVSLQTLTMSDVACAKDGCEGHIIALSNNIQLRNISLRGYNQVCVCGVYNPFLETCVICNCMFSHDLCSSLTTFLSQAVSLRVLTLSDVTCAKDDCEGHSIDLSNNNQLLSLDVEKCNQVCVSGVNTTNLETCEISECKFSHQICSLLTSSLSLPASLEMLTIKKITCAEDTCEGHTIDLSDDKNLQKLELHKCNQICVCGVNISKLVMC